MNKSFKKISYKINYPNFPNSAYHSSLEFFPFLWMTPLFICSVTQVNRCELSLLPRSCQIPGPMESSLQHVWDLYPLHFHYCPSVSKPLQLYIHVYLYICYDSSSFQPVSLPPICPILFCTVLLFIFTHAHTCSFLNYLLSTHISRKSGKYKYECDVDNSNIYYCAWHCFKCFTCLSSLNSH